MRALCRNRTLRVFVAWTTCLTLITPPAAMAGDGLFGLFGGYSEGTPVEQLARQIDKLEKHIDECGSIVIKTPDVWGESRLMRHRADVEGQLKAKLGAFDFRINAVQSTRDAAFLATAVALQEQINAGTTVETTTTPANGTSQKSTRTFGNDVGAMTGGGATTNATSVNGATFGLIGNPNDVGSATNPPFVSRSAFYDRGGVVGATSRNLNVNIEPTIELDQMNRYLQHLNELRRLNEGDDNSDTPGYALNLIRIPVSVLPGRRTEQGFGAEVQITIDPYMSDEILPMAFKDFVIKGLVDRIGFDVFQIAQGADIDRLDKDVNGGNSSSSADEIASRGIPPLQSSQSSETPAALPEPQPTTAPGSSGNSKSIEQEQFYNSLKTQQTYKIRSFLSELDVPGTTAKKASQNAGLDKVAPDDMTPSDGKKAGDQVLQYRLLADVNHRDLSIPASYRESVSGNNSLGLQAIALHVYDGLVSTGASSFASSRGVVPSDHRLDHGLTMPEVDTLLTRETESAYQFLTQPAADGLWVEFCTPDLARRLREHRTHRHRDMAPTLDSVEYVRLNFRRQVELLFPEAYGTVTEALAWQIILESALVNERLITDMKETATLKNCPCIPTDCMSFYGPNPPPEAHEAFRQYVNCKWPIHVFALDPVTQDQNISDSFSQRREMQMAMAIAASSRQLGGQAMSQFVRRMEYDLETIQLNRTAVAFSHGNNTFGWRFYPRVQAPPVPSNLSAVTHDLLIGGQDRNKLLNTHRLEPGIRECTALVVMPSFVPQVMVDVRTDWFRLAKHVPIHPFNKRKPDHEDSMELSKKLTELRCLQTQCMNDAHLYRDGDVYRLCKAVERLEDRLPMQTHNVSVPWENDLGGFEVFQSGTQVLGPEIHGWYGAPGILVFNETVKRNALANLAMLRELERQAQNALDRLGPEPVPATADPARKTAKDNLTAAQANVVTAKAEYTALLTVSTDTAVFLVGKNFSVLNCRVIAGGVDVTETIEVINRNLMQVRIPSTVSTVSTNHDSGEHRQVVVHLATPYGATSRLLIPVAGEAKASDDSKAVKAAEDAAKAAAASAQASAEATADVTEVTWGENATNPVYNVSIFYDRNATKPGFDIESIDMDPTDQMPTDILIRQSLVGTDGKDAVKLVNGKLVVAVKFAGITKAIKLDVVDLANGDINGGTLTPKDLFIRIMTAVQGKLHHSPPTSIEITVLGYVRFADTQEPIARLKNTITYKLTVTPKPTKVTKVTKP